MQLPSRISRGCACISATRRGSIRHENIVEQLGSKRGAHTLIGMLRSPKNTAFLIAAKSLADQELDSKIDNMHDLVAKLKGKKTDDVQRTLLALFTLAQNGNTPVKKGVKRSLTTSAPSGTTRSPMYSQPAGRAPFPKFNTDSTQL